MKLGTSIAMAAMIMAGCASAAHAQAGQHARHHQASTNSALEFSSMAHGDGRFELTLSGRAFTSRDAIEGELLRRAAELALSKGADWFVLMHLRGEQPGKHPARPQPAFGAAYGHWQPHWSYYQAGAWQPWHPEWNAPFWADRVDRSTVGRVEVHAMIETGRGPKPEEMETVFDARQVARDLGSFR